MDQMEKSRRKRKEDDDLKIKKIMDQMEKSRRKRKQDDDLKNKIKKMSKEALAAAMAKKKECNARAMMIVEHSLEIVDETWLLDNLKHINQSHFQDIVEERAIIKLCGYPLCAEEITDVPKKIYKISTRENKVYDLTDRKNYCSGTCYKAGTYLKDQLYTSPLWLRDCEIPVVYKILPQKERGKSAAGAEIDLGNTKPVKLDKFVSDGKTLQKNNTLIHKSSSTEETTSLESDNERPDTLLPCLEKDELNTELMLTENKQKSPQSHNSTEENLKLDSSVREKENNQEVKSNNKPYDSNTVDEEPKVSRVDMQIKKRRALDYSYRESVTIIRYVERNIESWFSLDSMIYVLGPEKARENLKASGFVEEFPLNKKNTEFYSKCQEIYKKLNVVELKDKEKQKPSKPVPEYDALQKESEDLELRVESFLGGDDDNLVTDPADRGDIASSNSGTERDATSDVPDYVQLRNNTGDLELKVKSFLRGDKIVAFSENDASGIKSTETGTPIPFGLPLIDHYEMVSSRRRIFMTKLKKVLPDMLNALDLSDFKLGSEIQELVATFNLSPSNLSMKLSGWRLAAIIMIKLLTIRSVVLNFIFTSELTQKRLMTYLLSYNLDGGYLDRFTSHLMDIDRIVSLLDAK